MSENETSKSAAGSAPGGTLVRMVVLAALIAIVWTGMDRIHVARGDSVEKTLFWTMPQASAELGSFVSFHVSHPIIGASEAALTKLIVCDEGMTIAIVDHTFFCDGNRLGGYLTQTWDGKPLTAWEGGVIPAGQAFVMGQHPRSFDSRYFGPVAKDKLVVVKGIL